MPNEHLSNVKTQQLKRGNEVENIEERLQQWFKQRMPKAENLELLAVNRTSGEAGMSADMFIVSARWKDVTDEQTKEQKFVVRAEYNKPTNTVSNAYHMMSALKILGNKTQLPIPNVLWAEHDESILGGPFCVMTFIEGRVAPDSPPFSKSGWVFEATQAQQEQMYLSGIQFLTDLHSQDWEALGLDFLLQRQHGVSHTQVLLNKAIDIYDQAVDGKRGKVEEATIAWLNQNIPADENLKICWGDSRPGNMLWQEFKLQGAIDWEMITLLDPSYDVALWLYADHLFTDAVGIQRLPGMFGREKFLETYENLSGKKLINYDYYEAYCAFRSHAVVTDMMATWQKHGQNYYGEGVTFENNPAANAFKIIMKRHI